MPRFYYLSHWKHICRILKNSFVYKQFLFQSKRSAYGEDEDNPPTPSDDDSDFDDDEDPDNLEVPGLCSITHFIIRIHVVVI